MIETTREIVSFTTCFPIIITLTQIAVRLLHDTLSYNEGLETKLCYQDLAEING